MSSSSSRGDEPVAPGLAGRALNGGGRLAYAALFVFVLPVCLALWARDLDRFVVLPPVGGTRLGFTLAFAGAALMVVAIITLRICGGGWPMSPYPPGRFVSTGVYAIVAHPIYAGFTLLVLGVAMTAESAAGVWIVSPVIAASCTAFVWGYERSATKRLFGNAVSLPLIHIPRPVEERPKPGDRLSIYALLYLPWFLSYDAVNALGPWRDAIDGWSTIDARVSFIGWTEIFYFSAYPLVLLAPLIAAATEDLRKLFMRGWLAIAVVTLVYLTVPIVLPPKPVPAGAALSTLLEWERYYEQPVTAFPAFHVIWPMLVAPIFARRFPALRPFMWLLVALIAVSCLTTGMHSIADVLAGLVFGGLFLASGQIWHVMIKGCEKVAGSWREWRIGPLRLINHGIVAGLAGGAGLLLIVAAAGEASLMPAVAITGASVIGAALWAQGIEGRSGLLRPYGFYGAVVSALLAITVAGSLGADAWLLLAAFALAASFIQAIGRARCLIQGCCHGRPTRDGFGMEYAHPSSRVVRLTALGGRPLHATQLYSILINLAIGVLLFRLWVVQAPLSLIVGAWLILSALQRFVEEHYRGEPQTPVIMGLPVYQWMAMGSLILGAILMSSPTVQAPAMTSVSATSFLIALAVGLLLIVAYGVDFPESTRRFSRLT